MQVVLTEAYTGTLFTTFFVVKGSLSILPIHLPHSYYPNTTYHLITSVPPLTVVLMQKGGYSAGVIAW